MRKRKWLVLFCVVCLAAAAANLVIARIIAQRIRRTHTNNPRTQHIFDLRPSSPGRNNGAAAKSENRTRPFPQKRGSKRSGGDVDGMPLRN